ncbi:MAG: hypothetical protein WC966_10200 [Bradymonadales bacterium]
MFKKSALVALVFFTLLMSACKKDADKASEESKAAIEQNAKDTGEAAAAAEQESALALPEEKKKAEVADAIDDSKDAPAKLGDADNSDVDDSDDADVDDSDDADADDDEALHAPAVHEGIKITPDIGSLMLYYPSLEEYQVNSAEALAALPIDADGVMRGSIVIRNTQVVDDDLAALFTKLKIIRGNLEIVNNSNLTDLKAFDRVEAIEGSLTIKDNKKLEKIWFHSLRRVGRWMRSESQIEIANNPALTTGGMFLSLVRANRVVWRQKVPRFSKPLNITGGVSLLNAVSETEQSASCKVDEDMLGGKCVKCYVGDITLKNAEDTPDLGNAKCIAGNVSIKRNAELSGFEQIERIYGKLEIEAVSSLTDLQGLAKLHSVVGDVEIRRNPELSSLSGLNELSMIDGSLSIAENPKLESLAGLEELFLVGYDLLISRNAKLANLDGLTSLSEVGHDFKIIRNIALKNSDALAELTTVGNAFMLNMNGQLPALNTPKLKSVGHLAIFDNKSLKSIATLKNVTMTGHLLIAWNRSLATLEGLDNLEHVVGRVIIYNNDALRHLKALNSMVRLFDIVEDYPESFKELCTFDKFSHKNGCEEPLLKEATEGENNEELGRLAMQMPSRVLIIMNHPNLKTLKGFNPKLYVDNHSFTHIFGNSLAACELCAVKQFRVFAGSLIEDACFVDGEFDESTCK